MKKPAGGHRLGPFQSSSTNLSDLMQAGHLKVEKSGRSILVSCIATVIGFPHAGQSG
jgi:hypothetical protein